MRHRSWVLFAVGLASAGAGCGSGPLGCQSCTLIGCEDQFAATIEGTGAQFGPGTHRLEVLVDGVTSMCTFTFPTSPAAPACTDRIRILVAPATSCTQTGTVQQCQPIPNRFVETITILGTPAQVHIWQYANDTPIFDAAAVPSYAEHRPNGPSCAPVCRQDTASWTLD